MCELFAKEPVTLSARRAATRAIEQDGYAQRRACRLIGMEPKRYRHTSWRSHEGEVRVRLRALVAETGLAAFVRGSGRTGQCHRSSLPGR